MFIGERIIYLSAMTRYIVSLLRNLKSSNFQESNYENLHCYNFLVTMSPSFPILAVVAGKRMNLQFRCLDTCEPIRRPFIIYRRKKQMIIVDIQPFFTTAVSNVMYTGRLLSTIKRRTQQSKAPSALTFTT